MKYKDLCGKLPSLPLDLGEESYTLSLWAKPTKLAPEMDYKFAVGWYEGGGEYIQAKLGPGTFEESDYNLMSTINPTGSEQASIFPFGLSERLFNGSYGDNKINDIDGRGWRFGQDVPDGQITQTEDANFSVITAFPEELTDAVNTDFVLWEQGGSGTGAFVGFKDGYLLFSERMGGSAITPPGTSTSDMLVLDIPYSDLVTGGFTEGKLHDLRWEIRLTNGVTPARVRIWIDDNLMGESTHYRNDNFMVGWR